MPLVNSNIEAQKLKNKLIFLISNCWHCCRNIWI